MPNDCRVRNSFNFLREKAESGGEFSLTDFSKASGWKEETAKSYITKKLAGGLKTIRRDVYSVLPLFLRVKYQEYLSVFKQKHSLFTKYTYQHKKKVLYLEFFLPLTNENILRESLDQVFYKDGIGQLLKEIGDIKLKQIVAKQAGESEQDYKERIFGYVQDIFAGYSMYPVNGRFRSGKLLTRSEAAERETEGEKYLIDETTAVIRFILPIDDAANALQMKRLLHHLLVKSVIYKAKNEDEVWLLRVKGCSLSIWKKRNIKRKKKQQKSKPTNSPEAVAKLASDAPAD